MEDFGNLFQIVLAQSDECDRTVLCEAARRHLFADQWFHGIGDFVNRAMLWPKIVGFIASTGAKRDEVIDLEFVSIHFLHVVAELLIIDLDNFFLLVGRYISLAIGDVLWVAMG